VTSPDPWDLAIITPTRGRPASLARLITALQATCAGNTCLVVGLDADDPALGDYLTLLDPPFTDQDAAMMPFLAERVLRQVSPVRRGLGWWTNTIAAELAEGDGIYRFQARYLASLGDDHLPVTAGWDTQLIAAIEATGRPGIAYGDDRVQGENLPTAPVMSASIPAALGWMALPGLDHYWIDNVWADIGTAAACLHYRPEVTVEHLHWAAGLGVERDATYDDAAHAGLTGAEFYRYRDWADSGGPAHAANKIKEIR
jgi:hypothetical protein